MKTELPPIKAKTLGDRVPRRGHWLLAGLGRVILSAMGWRIVGTLPNVERAVLAVAPHTSNMDGVVGISAIQCLRIHVKFMAKHTLFEGRLGRLMVWLGGIPVNRDSADDVVDQTTAVMREKPFWLGLAPEGTREGAERWKTGFYRIAEQAGVPIVLATADYAKKEIAFPMVLETTGDLEGDLEQIFQCYAQVEPRHPEKLSAPLKAIRERR